MNLDEHPFIKSIPPDERLALSNEIDILKLKRGARIFEQGSEPDSLYLILEGVVAFNKTRLDGTIQSISETGEGNFFGEVGVFTGEPRALAAVVQKDCTIARVPRDTAKKIIEFAGPVRKLLDSVILHLNNTTNHYMQEIMQTEKLSLVGTMVSSILHDFKNPFSIISLGTHIISQRNQDDAHTLKICGNIEAQIRRMVDMANDLATFSKGEGTIEISRISLKRLFEFFRELNAPFFEDPSVTITMEDNDIYLNGDSSKLLRVLQNLVTNSIEAIHQTGDPGQIDIHAHTEGNKVIIVISDDGPGIPEKIHENFFEPFITFGKREGTGLGSAIVKSIIDAHRGRISFETSPGGTVFTVSIPNDLKLTF